METLESTSGMARAIPVSSASLTDLSRTRELVRSFVGWRERERGSRSGLPLSFISHGDLLLGYHLPGEPLTIHCKLVVVHSGDGFALSIQVFAVPIGAVLPAPQAQTIQPLARSTCQGRDRDHLHQHVVNLQTDHRLMTPSAHLSGNLEGDRRCREKRIGVVLFQLDSRREHIRL